MEGMGMMDMYSLLMGGGSGGGGGDSSVVVYAADPDGEYLTTEATWQDVYNAVTAGKIVITTRNINNNGWTGISYAICISVSYSEGEEYNAQFILSNADNLVCWYAYAESADGYLYWD